MGQCRVIPACLLLAALTCADASPILRFAETSGWGDLSFNRPYLEATAFSSITGINTPANNNAVVGCVYLAGWGGELRPGGCHFSVNAQSFHIFTVPGSTVDPGGCLDLNHDGICYFFDEDLRRFIPEYSGTLLQGQTKSVTVHADGRIEGVLVGTLAKPLANVYGVPQGPWFGTFKGKSNPDGLGPDIELEIRLAVPEPSTISLLGIGVIALSPFLVRQVKQRLQPN